MAAEVLAALVFLAQRAEVAVAVGQEVAVAAVSLTRLREMSFPTRPTR